MVTCNNQKLVIEFNKALNESMKRVSDPFLHQFGIKWFSYVRIFPDQRRLILHSKEDWLPHYFQHKLQNDIIHTKNLLMPAEGTCYVLWSGLEKSDVLSHAQDQGLANGLFIYKRRPKSIDVYGFTTLKENTGINDFYLNNKNILSYFTFLFYDKFSHILNNVEEKILIQPNIKLDLSDSYFPFVMNKEKISEFYASTDVERLYFDFMNQKVYATKQEMKCLAYLAKGYTEKETGELLKLSPKTVEFYIKLLKDRTMSNNTSDLIKRYLNCFYE